MSARRVLVTLVAVAAGTLTATIVPSVAAGTADESPAYLRAAHLVPDLPAMDVTLSRFAGPSPDGPAEPLLTITAGYGDVGRYAPLDPGFYAVALRPAGSPPETAPVLTATFEARPGQAYTGAGVGTAEDAEIALFEDDLAAPGDGRSRIRVINAARDADPVQVRAVDGPVVAAEAGYATATTYATVPAQTWMLEAAGGSLQGTSTTELAPNAVYSLLVLEGEDGSLAVEPVLDASGSSVSPVGGAATGLGGGPGDALPAVPGPDPIPGVSPTVIPGVVAGLLVAVLVLLAVALVAGGGVRAGRRPSVTGARGRHVAVPGRV
jgi:hypothetical protein